MNSDIQNVLDGTNKWAIVKDDCLSFLAALPDNSVSLVFGSPPYEKARTYFEDGKDLGIARDTQSWVDWMVEVYRAALRVCTGLVAFVVEGQTKEFSYSGGPLLLGAALIQAGITLRKPPIFHRSGIPGGGGPDWWRNDYEFILCATRGGKLPWSDNTATGHSPKYGPGGDPSHRLANGQRANRNAFGISTSTTRRRTGTDKREAQKSCMKKSSTSGYKSGDCLNEGIYAPPALANPGNVVHVSVGGGSMGNRLCHENEAPFPENLVEPFVLSFCQPGGICCDPFSGSGTTGSVAIRWGRRFLGCDIRESMVRLSEKRISSVTPTLFP